jgi:D-arabinose 5-phosphate isomerase GutQ
MVCSDRGRSLSRAAVVELVIADQPEYDPETHYLTQKQTPELINSV